jgi:DNA-binding SARP family transcriptional activator
MPTIDLTLCSPPSLRVEGEPPSDHGLPTKSLALLAFLAVESGTHSREKLATLLWGESSDEKANASLRQALSTLRRTLGDQITITRTAVGLEPGVTSDVQCFLTLAQTEPATAGKIEVWRFLEGFAPRHCPAFDDWVEAVRGDLRARYCRCLATAGREALARRAWREAVALGTQWLRVDPDSGGATLLLVEALYLSGDTTGAMDAHEAFLARQAANSGAPPPAELRALVARISNDRPPPDRPASNDSWHEVSEHFEAGLAGRAAEWAALGRAWAEARRGSGRVVVVEGDLGAGKTRLADDYCRWVITQGGQVLRARAYESGVTTQIGTMLELLLGALQCPGVAGADPIALGIVARILPEVRRRFPTIAVHDAEPGTAVLEEAIADLLLAIAEDAPLVVVVDDFHWCDPETGAMVHYLARRLGQAPIVWYVALTLGHEEQDAPAIRVARALRAIPGVERLELAPLTVEEVWAVLRDLGRIRPGTTARRLARRVHEITHGNPFFVIELLKTWLAEGWFTPDPETGEWIVSDRSDFEVHVGTVSPSVQEAIAQRVERLPGDQQALLATIAAHDHGCQADVLAHVHGMSRLRIAALSEALERRFLVGEPDGRYECAHPIIGSVVLTSMGQARRRELHRAIALAMVQAAQDRGGEPDPGEVAYHADLGEEQDLAYEYALRVTEESRALGATAEALHWLDIAARWARTRDETAAVDRATAELLGTGHVVKPRPPAGRGRDARLSRHDFDLADGMGSQLTATPGLGLPATAP